jgi:hypothetical protein
MIWGACTEQEFVDHFRSIGVDRVFFGTNCGFLDCWSKEATRSMETVCGRRGGRGQSKGSFDSYSAKRNTCRSPLETGSGSDHSPTQALAESNG